MEQSIEYLLGMGLFLVYLVAGASYNFAQIFTFLFLFAFSGMLLFAVVSHYRVVRKMKKHSQEVINSVMDGD